MIGEGVKAMEGKRERERGKKMALVCRGERKGEVGNHRKRKREREVCYTTKNEKKQKMNKLKNLLGVEVELFL